MKYLNLKKWKYSPELEGLLFFAQLVVELLFDYTIDTYKVPAMNSHGLSDELYQTISEVESGAIKLAAIKPIKEELCDRLTKDPVAISILGGLRNELISCLNRNDTIAQTRVRAELLQNKLGGNEYLAESKKLLKETLADIKQKEKINSITRTLITELINIGYSPEYIYFETIKFFFMAGKYPSVIDNVSLMDDYLEKFSGKKLNLSAVFRASENFNHLKGFAQTTGITIQSDTPSIKFVRKAQKETNFLSENQSLPLYLIVNDIEACDVFSAREGGDEEIQLLDSFARYHVHRQDFNWSDEAIICGENNHSLGIYDKPVAATLKRPEPDINRLSALTDATFRTVMSKNLKEESFLRIVRAFIRHDVAVKSEAPESQLLELWAAIEVLFTTYESGEEKILQIARLIVPFETMGYAAKVASYLYRAIRNSSKPEALKIINEIEKGSNEIEKCLALVSIQDNEEKRNKLYEALGEHVLLINKIFNMKKMISSADSIRSMLIAHDQRVTWQIQRIYRARNRYIHSGKSLPYVKILVENLHSYLDRVLDVLIERIKLTEHLVDIDQICLDVRLGYEAHLQLLEREKGEVCNQDNYKVLLFGR